MKKQLLALALLFVTLNVMAQDSKQTFTRKVVLEQFTTGACQYCPAGADRISSAVDGMNNLIWIKHHAGFGTDDLTNAAATAYTAFFGGSTYAPALMVDRTRFDGSKPGPVTGVGQSSEIRALISQARGVETSCKVYPPEVTFNADTRHLSGTVSGRFGDDSFGENTRISVYVVEDSFYMYQADAYNGSGYIYHMSAVRAAITDIWGDPLTVEGSNNGFTYTIDYPLPDEFVYKNCRIVVLVHNYDASNINNCMVLNAAESDYLDHLLGIGDVTAGSQLRLYPNPASQQVFLQSDQPILQVTLVNTLGQTLLRQQPARNTATSTTTDPASAATTTVSLDITSLTPGLYLVQVQTPSGLSTRQLLVK